MRALKIGPGTDPEAEMGPLVTRAAPRQGAGLHRPGRARGGASSSSTAAASRCRATRTATSSAAALFDRVTPEMTIWKEEIFGPVLSVVRAPDYTTAAGMINAHEFANGTAIFTRDGDAARDFAHEIQVGMVGHQHADPGADGVPQLRRLEELAVRRPPHARPRGRAVLHPAEDDHDRAGPPASGPGPTSSCRRCARYQVCGGRRRWPRHRTSARRRRWCCRRRARARPRPPAPPLRPPRPASTAS